MSSYSTARGIMSRDTNRIEKIFLREPREIDEDKKRHSRRATAYES